uniref:Scavenger receptor class B member 1 n=1 Tax=Rattus norvegicus TaxID=10116 RepID=G3V636_RAT|nr:scavenger receptor class B member 1 isoform X2 [Rattus norvegicus]
MAHKTSGHLQGYCCSGHCQAHTLLLGFCHLCGLRRLCRRPLQVLSPATLGRARGHGRQLQGTLGGLGAGRSRAAVCCARRYHDSHGALAHQAAGAQECPHRPQQPVLWDVEGDPCSLLLVRLLLRGGQPQRGPKWPEASSPGARTLCLQGGAVMMEDKPTSLKLLMTLGLVTMGQRAFMNRTVGEILWGYEDPFVNFLSKYFPDMFPIKGKFGLFVGMNDSSSGVFTVFTGVQNFSKIHLVDKWNGLSEVNYWHSEQCNMINGTAGQMWAPFMTPESSLEFFSPEACRSMKLTYQESRVFEGIPTYRFTAPDTLFANGSVYPPNEGFCPCRESGIQNVSTCRFGAPLFLSQPHFYNADPVLSEAVLGLNPDPKEHSLFLDIHPVTGIPMNCSVKMQLSLYIKSVKGVGQTGKIEPVVLPLLWFEQSGMMGGKTLNTFYTQLVLMPQVLHYAQYVLLGLGGLLLLVPIIYQLRSQGPEDTTSPPNLIAWSDQPPSPYTPLLEDSLSGQPASATS